MSCVIRCAFTAHNHGPSVTNVSWTSRVSPRFTAVDGIASLGSPISIKWLSAGARNHFVPCLSVNTQWYNALSRNGSSICKSRFVSFWTVTTIGSNQRFVSICRACVIEISKSCITTERHWRVAGFNCSWLAHPFRKKPTATALAVKVHPPWRATENIGLSRYSGRHLQHPLAIARFAALSGLGHFPLNDSAAVSATQS